MSSKIVTYSGRAVDPLALKLADVDHLDIAHALSNHCRFSGHVRKFYSVAEHSVRVTRWVKGHGGSLDDQKWALLHDATEAYLIDLPKPLKADPYFGKAFRGAEGRVEAVIAEKFKLSQMMPMIVHFGDSALFAAEKRDLMPESPQWKLWDIPSGIEIPHHEIKPWTPAKAERKFLETFERLFG